MNYPKNIQKLIELLSKLPTVGPKTAERYALYLLKQPSQNLEELSNTIANLKNDIKTCQTCLNISESEICSICADKNRNIEMLCLVANFSDIISFEKTKKYQGYYFVLGGLIDTINNVRPEDLNVKKLVDHLNQLLKNGKNLEIILALPPTIEGETTSMYLSKILKNPKIKITRLARGLPTGANLEYADEITLGNALIYRNEIQG